MIMQEVNILLDRLLVIFSSSLKGSVCKLRIQNMKAPPINSRKVCGPDKPCLRETPYMVCSCKVKYAVVFLKN